MNDCLDKVKTVNLSDPLPIEPCGQCEGRGRLGTNEHQSICHQCNGQGFFVYPYRNCIGCNGHCGNYVWSEEGNLEAEPCPRCEGRGTEPLATCINCRFNLWLDAMDEHEPTCKYHPYYSRFKEDSNNYGEF